MGMTVVGTPENILRFNFATSSDISLIEAKIMNGIFSVKGNFDSVAEDIINDYLFNSTSVEVFMQNGFIIEKPVFNNNDIILIDTETGIVRDINTINNYCGAYSNEDSSTFLAEAFDEQVSKVGETILVGSASFNWDGQEDVYIASSSQANPNTDTIWADDALTVTGEGTLSAVYGNGWTVIPGSDMNIDSILNKGGNVITASIHDIYGVNIGCCNLYVVEVNDPINYYTTFPSWPGIITDLIDGKQHLNQDYFTQGAIVGALYSWTIFEDGSLVAIPELDELGMADLADAFFTKATSGSSFMNDGNNFQQAVANWNKISPFTNSST